MVADSVNPQPVFAKPSNGLELDLAGIQNELEAELKAQSVVFPKKVIQVTKKSSTNYTNVETNPSTKEIGLKVVVPTQDNNGYQGLFTIVEAKSESSPGEIKPCLVTMRDV